MRHRRRTIALAAATVAALAAGGGAVALGGDDDDARDTPITGAALERASAAALDHVGGGTVTGTEVGDEEGFYEVEVTRPDGRQVDVHLDRAFGVLSTEGDDDGSEDGS